MTLEQESVKNDHQFSLVVHGDRDRVVYESHSATMRGMSVSPLHA